VEEDLATVEIMVRADYTPQSFRVIHQERE